MASAIIPPAGREDRYEIGVAYANGKPIGKVTGELISLDQADPGRLRPYIGSFLREEIVLRAQLPLGRRHPC
jgi:hypothetical protein